MSLLRIATLGSVRGSRSGLLVFRFFSYPFQTLVIVIENGQITASASSSQCPDLASVGEVVTYRDARRIRSGQRLLLSRRATLGQQHANVAALVVRVFLAAADHHPIPMAHPEPERHLLRARDLADTRYADTIDVAAMASAAGLSRAHFSRSFARAFGESPGAYLMTRRLERAAALLRNTDHGVAEVCFEVGLASVGSFTTSFRRIYGQTPTQYRACQAPAATWVMVPSCLIQEYARRRNRTIREDSAAAEG
ncbi:MAG: helix-turn-helix domain-containing protein [Solirubrobacteraceae bacterium]